ncbi:hypothetical protein V8E53_006973 [Lactarius tabidus]
MSQTVGGACAALELGWGHEEQPELLIAPGRSVTLTPEQAAAALCLHQSRSTEMLIIVHYRSFLLRFILTKSDATYTLSACAPVDVLMTTRFDSQDFRANVVFYERRHDTPGFSAQPCWYSAHREFGRQSHSCLVPSSAVEPIPRLGPFAVVTTRIHQIPEPNHIAVHRPTLSSVGIPHTRHCLVKCPAASPLSVICHSDTRGRGCRACHRARVEALDARGQDRRAQTNPAFAGATD